MTAGELSPVREQWHAEVPKVPSPGWERARVRGIK
jgi:hypothetical protein